MLFQLFEKLANVIDTIYDGISKIWRAFADGPLFYFTFYLLLVITGIIVIITAICEEVDRLFAKVEKVFIAIALLIMTALSFLDYMRRELSFFSFEVDGGPNFAVVLMVWVGFLGASLATRQRKHLAVDASDRILSTRAARLTKRLSSLIAAGFCWYMLDVSLQLIDQNLIAGTGQEALPLWDSLQGPINALGSVLHPETPHSLGVILGACALLGGFIYQLRILRDEQYAHINIVENIGAVLIFCTGLLFISHQWQPEMEDGKNYTWVELLEAKPTEKANLQDIANLVGGDTGEEEANDIAELADFVDKSSGGTRFPMWLAQSVIPLSFLIMALRFLALGLSGRFEEEEDEEEDEEEEIDAENISAPPPQKVWIRSENRGSRDLIFAGVFPGILLGLGAALGMSMGQLVFFGCILLLLVGSPLFLVIGVASVACVTLIQEYSAVNIAKDMYEAVKKEELLAIPFFVLAGNLMTQGSIADRLVGVARAIMGKTPGGLGLASIFACVIFAAISGSSPVTVIAVGSVMFPMLRRERYPEDYSLGVLTSAGSLGIIIPPSVPMIVYAIMVSNQDQQVSPNDLFVAGVLPGLFIAMMLAFYTLYQTRPTRKDIDIVIPDYEGTYFENLFGEMKRSILALMLPILVLGGIYGVLGPLKFTVTEAAAVAVVYALVIELFVHRELKWKKLPKVLSDSGVMMGTLFLIIVLAIAFNKFLAEQYIPQNAAAWMQEHVSNKWQFLILVNLFLLALGCVMEIISAILIVAPLLAPIAMSYDIHPLHFGIMFIVNLELGYLTPPLGINLFVSSTVFNRPVVDVMKGALPFLFLMLFCLIVIIFVPSLSLILLGEGATP
jgi:C4-dicarboxylate transporter, DctM subunit